MMTDILTKMNECRYCKHKRAIPGDCHILCVKPDPKMQGNVHGIKNGWFMYPFNFDPIWKNISCNNFEKIPGLINE